MTPPRVIPISVGIKITLSPKMIITIDAISRMFFTFILNKSTNFKRLSVPIESSYQSFRMVFFPQQINSNPFVIQRL